MKGEGFYDQHSGPQLSSILAVKHWIEEAIASLEMPAPPHEVTVLDLGSSEGRNAVRLMSAIVAALRQRSTQPIETFYCDLPSNNFNQLFTNIQEALNGGRFASDTYPAAVAGSFYNEVLPSGTVHFATSFNSVMWLDHLPDLRLSNRVVYRRPQPPGAGLPVSAEVRAAFQTQGTRDLNRFLENRAHELAPGGKLLLAAPGDTESACISDGLYDVLNDAMLDLVADNRVSPEEYERFTVPVYFRTLAELRAPLEPGGPLHGAFDVDRAETMEVPIPFVDTFRSDGNLTNYAASYTSFVRAFSEPIVRAAFQRPGAELNVIESLYDRIRARLVTEPDRYEWRYYQVAVLLTRR
jgi:hypothetical protein